jgi:hypothetical protein
MKKRSTEKEQKERNICLVFFGIVLSVAGGIAAVYNAGNEVVIAANALYNGSQALYSPNSYPFRAIGIILALFGIVLVASGLFLQQRHRHRRHR